MKKWNYTKGLHNVTEGVYAYLDPPGLWGGNNCGLIVSDGQSMVVDTKYDLKLTGELLEKMGPIPGALPADYLVNTHGDGDHIFGNELFRGAEIIASRTCAEGFKTEINPEMYAALIKDADNMGKLGQYFVQTFGRFNFEGITLTPPTRTFDGRMELNVGGKNVLLIEVGPAHTAGDIMVYLPEDRVIFTGDIIMTAPAPVSWEGPLDNVFKAMELIMDLDVEVLVPGHGPVADKSAVQDCMDYWVYTVAEARKLFDQNVSATEAARLLSAKGRYRGESASILNMINLHMLYRGFSEDDSPPDKPAVIGHIAEMIIPD